ncbi:MAG: zinc ABC transporter substrate-binding protein [Deltaproteobacteria bacterium]|nr:zinc ABC transporter substrate-binding protein [Deltaproteobacteria bacterium]
MKRSLLILLAALLAPAIARADEPLRVVTSIQTFADLAKRVGGDKVQVESLSHGYQDPHFVEAKPNLMLTLNRADLLIHVGLELEIGWLPPLVTGSRNEKIMVGQPGNLDCSQFIKLLDVPITRVDRSQGDIHPMGNPHYWIPPVNAVRIAKGISERLKVLRPQDAAYFDEQFKKFVADVQAHVPAWEAAAKPLAGQKVVTYHKSWSYVSAWLKLDEIGYIENKPGIPPSPDHLAQLITQMKAQGVKLLIVEDFYNRAIADDVAAHSGAHVVSAPSDVGAKPEIKTYFDLVDALLKALNNGLK